MDVNQILTSRPSSRVWITSLPSTNPVVDFVPLELPKTFDFAGRHRLPFASLVDHEPLYAEVSGSLVHG